MLTWQYATFGPLAGTIWLSADLMPGLPRLPARSAQLTGADEDLCALLVGYVSAANKLNAITITASKVSRTERIVPPSGHTKAQKHKIPVCASYAFYGVCLSN